MSIPKLHPDTSLQLLAEGAANVVYRFIAPQVPYSNVFLPDGRLLRLGKALPSRVCNQQSHRFFHETLETLFPAENLVSVDLIKLPAEVIDRCNRQLKADEQSGRRPAKRAGCYLAQDEPYGLLVSDMTPDLEKREVLIEFKPKWLVQSPTSPPGSRRCRTCALKVRRNAARRLKGEKQEIFLCPLDLASQDVSRVARAVDFLVRHSKAPKGNVPELQQRLMGFFLGNPLIARLKQLQRHFDPVGVLYADVSSRHFLTATTIRDCTLYLRIPLADQGPIDARLGDLDLKSPIEGKAEYWKAVERDLIEEGWYTGTEDEPQVDRSWCDLT